MASQTVATPDAPTAKSNDKPRITIHRACDAAEVTQELMPYLGINETDEKGIAEAVEAGVQNGDFVKLLFADEARGMSLTYAWFKPNFLLPRHSHNADCAYYVISGEVHLGTEVLKAGDVFFVPSDHAYTYVAGPEGVEVLECRTTDAFHIKFSGNSAKFWSRMAGVATDNAKAWDEVEPPLAAKRMMEAG